VEEVHKRPRSRNQFVPKRSLGNAVLLKHAQFTPHNPRVGQEFTLTWLYINISKYRTN